MYKMRRTSKVRRILYGHDGVDPLHLSTLYNLLSDFETGR